MATVNVDRATEEQILGAVEIELGRASGEAVSYRAKLLTALLESVQAAVVNQDPLPIVARLYTEYLVTKLNSSPDQARQSWVSVSGNTFQGTVRFTLNGQLVAEGIRAVSVSELSQYPAHLRTFLMLPARRRCVQASFNAWPDNDIMLLTRAEPTSPNQEPRVVVFGVISCKTSFHARETESCFWALATRDTGIRMGLVTQDRSLELGTCIKPTKARMLLEAYFDRVFSTNPATSNCAQIRPFDEILGEVRRWRHDVAPDMITDDWS